MNHKINSIERLEENDEDENKQKLPEKTCHIRVLIDFAFL